MAGAGPYTAGGRQEGTRDCILSQAKVMTMFPFLSSRNAVGPVLGGLGTGMHSYFSFKMAAGHDKLGRHRSTTPS